MEIPDDLRYSADHEWVRVAGGEATVGISDFAQDSLGDVVYVALPQVGESFSRNERCAEVESTKSVSEIYAPVGGTVVAVNETLSDAPELLNSSPYGEGWILRLTIATDDELDALLDAAAYRALVE